VKLQSRAKISSDVDKILCPTQSGFQALVPKELKRRNSGSGVLTSSLSLLLEASIRDGQTSTAVSQAQDVPLRYGSPFRVTHCTRLIAGKIWCTVTLDSQLPCQAEAFGLELESFQYSAAGSSAYSLAAGASLRATFFKDAATDSGLDEIEQSCAFKVRYRLPSGHQGVCQRQVCFRQRWIAGCIRVSFECANSEPVRVGSCAEMVYTLSKEPERTLVLEPHFASPSVESISIAARDQSSPTFSRKRFAGQLPDQHNGQSTSLVAYALLFDRDEWAIVGTERGHVDLAKGTFVTCEFAPLKSGCLRAPLLQVANAPTAPPSFVKQFIKVLD